MNPALPPVDDTLVWDAWLSLYRAPSLSAALELGIFEALDQEPASPKTLAERLGYSERALTALLPMLMALGFLNRRAGDYQLTEAARHYMLSDSAYFWGPFFARNSKELLPHKMLLTAVRGAGEAATKMPVEGWESGHIDVEMAREVTAFMHCHSMPAAVGLARHPEVAGIGRLLDVGGGSGCFAIALAAAHAEMRCTVMELPTICDVAKEYIAAAGLQDRVDTVTVDMFRQPWPRGYDAMFFSNVFHDWNMQTCAELAAKAFEALPSGGRILLHEMLLDDGGAAPLPAVAFSLLMAMGTKGQQFTFGQLEEILSGAGFKDISSRDSYGYYSLVTGIKP